MFHQLKNNVYFGALSFCPYLIRVRSKLNEGALLSENFPLPIPVNVLPSLILITVIKMWVNWIQLLDPYLRQNVL